MINDNEFSLNIKIVNPYNIDITIADDFFNLGLFFVNSNNEYIPIDLDLNDKLLLKCKNSITLTKNIKINEDKITEKFDFIFFGKNKYLPNYNIVNSFF